mmetsp:Transcript_38534/g.111325  ORF Transcript_38534/g.111325 Transcript_38534/m.111325 type:complete len:245 (+) Transcript_38534:2728-3462(+)
MHWRRALHPRKRIHQALSLELRPPLEKTSGNHNGGQNDRSDNVITAARGNEEHFHDHRAPQENVEDACKDLLCQPHPNVLLLCGGNLVLSDHLLERTHLLHVNSSWPVLTLRIISEHAVLRLSQGLDFRTVHSSVVVLVTWVLAGGVEGKLALLQGRSTCNKHRGLAGRLLWRRLHRERRIHLGCFHPLGEAAIRLALHRHLAGDPHGRALVVVSTDMILFCGRHGWQLPPRPREKVLGVALAS